MSSQGEPPSLSEAMSQLALLIESQLPDIQELLKQLKEIEDWTIEVTGSITFQHQLYHMPDIHSQLVKFVLKLWKSISIDKSFCAYYSDERYLAPYREILDRLGELSQDLSLMFEDLLSFQLDEVGDAEDTAALFLQLEYNFLRFDQVVFRFTALVTYLRLQVEGEEETDHLRLSIITAMNEALKHES